MSDCLFCKIISGEIPGHLVYEDKDVVAFKDIDPKAPLHLLIVPRQHIETLNDLSPTDDSVVGALVRRAAALAKQHGYSSRGYRTLLNCNRDAGQSVFHVHLHLLAGRSFGWPPG